MERRQSYSWASAILSLSPTFLRNISSGMINERQCIVLYSLADCMAHYAKHWWIDLFYEETNSSSAAAIGMELFKALKKGLELIQLCAQKKCPAIVWTILSGVAQFHEIVEDARRYSQMMNRLIQRHTTSSSQNPGKKQQLAQQLRHKVEFDCRVLQTRLEWAYEQDKAILLQILKSQESGGMLPNILRPFWRERPAFHDSVTSCLISILETGFPLNIDSRNLYPREYLGCGAFGRVSKTQWCELPVALKEFPSEQYFLKEFELFIKFLTMGFSSHIVGIIGCSENKSIVLELMDKDLVRLIGERRTADSSPFPLEDSIDIMLQIAMGMRHLHDRDVTYRDLKPSNVLIQVREDQSFLVKLADFGVSKHNFKTAEENTSNSGTRRYMAPEMMKEGGNYSRKVDVHSYGMVCFEILTGKQPYLDAELVMQGKRPLLPEDIPISLDKLIQRCWNEDANARPSFEEICDELWLIRENILLEEETDSTTEITELKFSISGLSCLKVEYASTVEAEPKVQDNDPKESGPNVVLGGSVVLDTIYTNQPFPPLSLQPADREEEETISGYPRLDEIVSSSVSDETNLVLRSTNIAPTAYSSSKSSNSNLGSRTSQVSDETNLALNALESMSIAPTAYASSKSSDSNLGSRTSQVSDETNLALNALESMSIAPTAYASSKSSDSNLGSRTTQTVQVDTSSRIAKHEKSRFLNWLKFGRLGKKQETDVQDWKAKLKETGIKEFKYSDLKIATKGFSDEQLLGQGAFGRVYRGHMGRLGGHTEVAVKVLKEASSGGKGQFVDELLIIGRLRHKNLVKLRGWCQERDKWILVYDYMQNGSLHEYLFQKKKFLPWNTRYEIVKGVAEGLVFLHFGWEQRILHRDIKAANVLLDAQMVAHLGDFGLAKLTDDNTDSGMTTVKGTAGYIAPEFLLAGRANYKSDIYSFGILLLEVACGRPAIQRHVHDREFVSISDYVLKAQKSKNLLKVVDPTLGSRYNKEEMTCVLSLGLLCSDNDPDRRPNTERCWEILNGKASLP